jgi:hypothetical protein
MLWWARHRENLIFELLDPYNETDLGYRHWMAAEGPGLKNDDLGPLTHVIIDKLQEYGLTDVELMVMSDSDPSIQRIAPFLQDKSMVGKVTHFGFHIYGGHEGVPKMLADSIESSAYKGSPKWMTEYGDLDLTTLVENRVAVRSMNMLIEFVNDGFTGGMVWDAYDNYHKHDEAWSEFGLLKTDTVRGTYTPKLRYFAAKQVYRFVPPGFKRIAMSSTARTDTTEVNWSLKDPFRYIKLAVFVSPDENELTFVGTSLIEGDVALILDLRNFSGKLAGKTAYVYRTSSTAACAVTDTQTIRQNRATVVLRPNEIVTLTTLGENRLK